MPYAGYGEWVELSATGVEGLGPGRGRRSARPRRPAEVWAIGDEWNDVPMFDWAGTAIAMGNAPAHVQAAADRVAPTADDDGVAVVLEELLGG